MPEIPIPDVVSLPNGQTATSEQLRPLVSRCSQMDRYLYADQVLRSIPSEERVRLYKWVVDYDFGVERPKDIILFFGLCVAAHGRPGSTPLHIANEITRAGSAIGILL